MAKRVSPENRKNSPVITMLPQRLREQMELLADAERVSLSEIGRRAVEQYCGTNKRKSAAR
jgi:hypothetical protein